MAAQDWMDPWDEQAFKRTQHAYKGKAGYGKGKPWHERRRTWTSRDGRVTPLKDLADSHLENILAFIRRKVIQVMVHQRRSEDIRAIIGDLKAIQQMPRHLDATEVEFPDDRIEVTDYVDPDPVLHDLPIYQALVAEADRRAAAVGLVPAPGEWVPPPRRPVRALTDREGEFAVEDGWGDSGWETH